MSGISVENRESGGTREETAQRGVSSMHLEAVCTHSWRLEGVLLELVAPAVHWEHRVLRAVERRERQLHMLQLRLHARERDGGGSCDGDKGRVGGVAL